MHALRVLVAPLRVLEGVPGLPGAPQDEAGLTRKFELGQEDPLEKEMATHSSVFAWEIPWREESGAAPRQRPRESFFNASGGPSPLP